jgi:hypothetical protein
MSVRISDSRSFKLEYQRKNRFLLAFTDIPGGGSEDALAFVCHTCGTPQITFNDVSTKRIHEKFNIAGTPTFNDLSCTFYDTINQSGMSAADILYNWSAIIYNPLTGQMGYKTQYATSATLVNLDPAGNVIRAWNIFSIFPQMVQFGDTLSYDDDGICDITVNFKYDLAIKAIDASVSGKSAALPD